MYLLFESIKLHNGKLYHLAYHQARVERSIRQLFGVSAPVFDLASEIHKHTLPEQGLYKCRLRYGPTPLEVSFQPYHRREVKSLKLVTDDIITYAHKFEDRKALQQLWEQRGDCDDVLIVRQGYLTDASYANVVLWNGQIWVTPETPLLPGTQRQRLLDCGAIVERPVRVEELAQFQRIGLINALNDLEEMPVLPIQPETLLQ